ncbi:hypothetical protein [Flavobacterium sp.]|uniref:hypothetical protein n=1 Tax=Flavobacterium sp. TaxID=239 RepID=UPI0039E63FEA
MWPRLIDKRAAVATTIRTIEMLQSASPILAVNFTGDTLVMQDEYSIPEKHFNYFGQDPASKGNFRIFIDTTYAFQSKGFVFRNLKLPHLPDFDSLEKAGYDLYRFPKMKAYFKTIDSLKATPVNAYPVLVYNASDTIQLVKKRLTDNGLEMIQEALDSDGIWKPIEFLYEPYACGTGHADFLILPKHYLAAAILKYAGDFKTKIRVKIRSQDKIYYSNEIPGSINRSQFDQNIVKEFLKQRDFFIESDFNELRKYMLLEF